MFSLNYKLNTGPLTSFGDRFLEEASKAIRMTAFMIEGDAKLNCPVDTGALRASIYTVTDSHSGYNDAISEAEAEYPGPGQHSKTINQGQAPIDPEASKPTDNLTAIVAVGMAYGKLVENGSADGKRAAQPFMGPAAEANKDFFNSAINKAIAEAAKNSGWHP